MFPMDLFTLLDVILKEIYFLCSATTVLAGLKANSFFSPFNLLHREIS